MTWTCGSGKEVGVMGLRDWSVRMQGSGGGGGCDVRGRIPLLPEASVTRRPSPLPPPPCSASHLLPDYLSL